jgi:hypothetical protein
MPGFLFGNCPRCSGECRGHDALADGFLIFIFLHGGVEFDRLGHKIVANGFQAGRSLTPCARQPDTPVGRFDKVFLGLQHDIPMIVSRDILSNLDLFKVVPPV